MMEMDGEIRVLKAQQEIMSRDMAEVKASLKSIADSLQSLAVLEQKHAETRDGIKRAHDRIDETVKKQDKTEERLYQIEIVQAKRAWIERAVTVIVMGVLGMWAKGMF